MGSGSGDRDAVTFVPVQQDIGQLVLDDEVQQPFGGLGVGPSVFVAVLDLEVPRFRLGLEEFVVIGAAAAAILHVVVVVEVMHHFVQQRGRDFLDGAAERSGPDVDFVGVADGRGPSVILQGEMTVGAGRALNGDGRAGQLSAEVMVIEKVEDFVEVSGNAIVRGQLFHFEVLPFFFEVVSREPMVYNLFIGSLGRSWVPVRASPAWRFGEALFIAYAMEKRREAISLVNFL